MPQFITRVELHSGTSADYNALHKHMVARNFHQFIIGDDGKRYHLPTAMYYSHGPYQTVQSVRDMAKQAADLTAKKEKKEC